MNTTIPKRKSPVPLRTAPQTPDRVLMSWALSLQPLRTQERKAGLGEMARVWRWAFEGVDQGASTTRASRFLRVVRERALNYRMAGAGAQAMFLACADLLDDLRSKGGLL